MNCCKIQGGGWNEHFGGRKGIMLISCNHKGRGKLLQELHSSDLQGFQLILLKLILDSIWKVTSNLNESKF